MRFQTTLEGAECLRRSDAGWQSVPGTRRSDEERAVTNRRTRPPHDVARSLGTEPYHADIERREQIV